MFKNIDKYNNDLHSISVEVWDYLIYFKDKDIVKDSVNDFYIDTMFKTLAELLDNNYYIINNGSMTDTIKHNIWRSNFNKVFINNFIIDHRGNFMVDGMDYLYMGLHDILFLIELNYNDETVNRKLLHMYIIQLVDIYRTIKSRY